jgi:CHAD domain-containing protein
MSFSLNSSAPVRRRLKQLVRHQLRDAGTALRDDGEGAVHAARKSVKKVRAIVGLLRLADANVLRKHERRLRAAGRALSTLRDSDAVIATFDRLRRRFPKRLPEHTSALIRGQLVRIKTRIVRKAGGKRRVDRTAHTLRDVRRSVKEWKLPDIDPLDLPDLLKVSYRRSRKAMRLAQKTIGGSDLHRWRKRIKSLWYQLRLLAPLAPGLAVQLQRLEQLETWLGEHHDLAVLQATLAGDEDLRSRFRGALAAVTVMCRSLQRTLRRKALGLGRRLLAERPKAYGRRLRQAITAPRRKRTSRRREPASTAA